MGSEWRFQFKRLNVYQEAVDHFAWAVDAVRRSPQVPFKVSNQVTGASLSILSNIGEANGRDQKAGEAVQHYRYAQGSTFECAAHLDALAALDLIDEGEYRIAEERLTRISSMLSGLIRRQRRRPREQRERKASAASP